MSVNLETVLAENVLGLTTPSDGKPIDLTALFEPYKEFASVDLLIARDLEAIATLRDNLKAIGVNEATITSVIDIPTLFGYIVTAASMRVYAGKKSA